MATLPKNNLQTHLEFGESGKLVFHFHSKKQEEGIPEFYKETFYVQPELLENIKDLAAEFKYFVFNNSSYKELEGPVRLYVSKIKHEKTDKKYQTKMTYCYSHRECYTFNLYEPVQNITCVYNKVVPIYQALPKLEGFSLEPDTYSNCVYAAAALFDELDNPWYKKEVKPEFLLLLGSRTEDGEEVNSLVHAVVSVTLNDKIYQIDPSDNFKIKEGSTILSEWADAYLNNPQNTNASIKDTFSYTSLYSSDIWEVCTEHGSPENLKLTQQYKRQINHEIAKHRFVLEPKND